MSQLENEFYAAVESGTNVNDSACETEKKKSNTNQSSSKRSAVDTNNNKRTKRLRSQTQRFGVFEFEENDDSLLDELETSSQKQTKTAYAVGVDENTPPIATNSQKVDEDPALNLLSPGEKILYKKMIELHADVKVLQRTVVTMEVRNSDCDSKKHGKRKELGVINEEQLQLLGLPLVDENGITGFDTKLKKKEFYDKVYNVFKAVGGVKGESNGEEVILKISDYMFTEQLQSNMTWTGKTKKQKRKISFKSFVEIYKIFFDLSKVADKNFNANDCHRVIVYKLLKNAYKKATADDDIEEELTNNVDNVQTMKDDDIFIVIPGDPPVDGKIVSQPSTSNWQNPQPYQPQYHQQVVNPQQYQTVQPVSGQQFRKIQQVPASQLTQNFSYKMGYVNMSQKWPKNNSK